MRSERSPRATQHTRRAILQGSAAIALLGWEGSGGSYAFANALHVGELAPPATLLTLDGQRVTTSELLGQVVILTFWATWCVPCREELPLLSDYFVQHSSEGLTVLAFSLDSPANLMRVKQVAESLRFAVGLFANSSATGYGRIWRIPVNFTIDRMGRLIDNGWKDKQPTWTQERLERVVTPLLGAAT